MVYNHVARKVNKVVQARIDALKIGQKMQDLPEELWHDSFRYYVKEDKNRKGGPNLRLIRLDPNQPSLTVTTFIFNKFVHPYENRYITVREAARLQGFPDDIEIKGSLTSTQTQIGNAVPVPLAEAVFNQICNFADAKTPGTLSAFSLFCGAGGLDIGAQRAGFGKTSISTKLAIDINEDACLTLGNYFGDATRVNACDVTKIDDPSSYWRENTGESEGPDLVYGGPPCQAFSQAGKQLGTGDPRGELIFDYLRFIENLHPKYFVLENVSNLKSINGGKLLSEILKKMDELGYNVSHSVVCAADYGAPQKRMRAVFIGTDKTLGKIDIPLPTRSSVENLLNLPPYVTVGEAFEGLPYIGSNTASK